MLYASYVRMLMDVGDFKLLSINLNLDLQFSPVSLLDVKLRVNDCDLRVPFLDISEWY